MCNNISLSPHFSLSEFTKSATALRHGISNVPPPEAVKNLKALCAGTLEPLRVGLELPVIITSGYRTKALNDMLAHASERSQHMQGQAADFYVQGSGSRRELLIRAFRLMLTSPDIDFDQLILYPSFIHVSYVSKEKNRRGILIGRGDGKLGYGRITRSNALKIN